MLKQNISGKFTNYDASVLCIFVQCGLEQAKKIVKQLNTFD